jgi:hypothetical protein
VPNLGDAPAVGLLLAATGYATLGHAGI